MLDGEDVYDRAVDPVRLRRASAWSSRRPNPFPTMSIRENVLAGLPAERDGVRDAEADSWSGRLRQAGLWDEVKDRLGEPGDRRSPAASSSGSASPGSIAVEPEVMLMDEPCSALDPISTLAIEELIDRAEGALHDRHRDPQHAAGGPGEYHHRLFQPRSCRSPGHLVESGPTAKMFSNPEDSRTAEYVAGRFG